MFKVFAGSQDAEKSSALFVAVVLCSSSYSFSFQKKLSEVLLVKNIQPVYQEVEPGSRCFDPSILPPDWACQTRRKNAEHKIYFSWFVPICVPKLCQFLPFVCPCGILRNLYVGETVASYKVILLEYHLHPPMAHQGYNGDSSSTIAGWETRHI